MGRDDLHFRLRIPEDLKKAIEEQAADNNRSMTAEIVSRLELSFRAEEAVTDTLVMMQDMMKELHDQKKVLEWMVKQQQASQSLLKHVVAHQGNLSPEFLQILKNMLEDVGTDTAFPVPTDRK